MSASAAAIIRSASARDGPGSGGVTRQRGSRCPGRERPAAMTATSAANAHQGQAVTVGGGLTIGAELASTRPEKRKVGGSTPAPDTSVHLRETALTCEYVSYGLAFAYVAEGG